MADVQWAVNSEQLAVNAGWVWWNQTNGLACKVFFQMGKLKSIFMDNYKNFQEGK
jgi:hypothetical protein